MFSEPHSTGRTQHTVGCYEGLHSLVNPTQQAGHSKL